MEIPKSIERIEKMRKGEKIECTRCGKGFVSAVGKPETTSCFRCDNCGRSIVLTRKLI